MKNYLNETIKVCLVCSLKRAFGNNTVQLVGHTISGNGHCQGCSCRAKFHFLREEVDIDIEWYRKQRETDQ